MTFLYVFGIIFLVFGISFALINIRHIFTGNEFRGTCATNNPMIREKTGACPVCGSQAGEECANPEYEYEEVKPS